MYFLSKAQTLPHYLVVFVSLFCLTSDTSAQKLQTIAGCRGPLWVIMECAILQAVRKLADVNTVVGVIGSLHGMCIVVFGVCVCVCVRENARQFKIA